MAKSTGKKAPAAAVVPKGAEATGLASAKRDTFELFIAPSGQRDAGIALRDQAAAITITDKATHGAALKLLREAKGIKRTIADHWSTLKSSVNKLAGHLRDLEREELDGALSAISTLERKALDYDRAEADRIAREQEAERQAAQERAAASREKELADAEAAALEAEAATDELSQREQGFVARVVRYMVQGSGNGSPIMACAEVGYKDPEKRASILMNTPKIQKAIEGLRAAAAIRQQADARRTQPVIPDVVNIEADTAKVSGVSKRVTYGCGSADIMAMLEAWKSGDITAAAFLPNMVYLNEQARTHKDLFEQMYPGCTLARKESYAG